MGNFDCLDGDSIVLKLIEPESIEPILLSNLKEGDRILGILKTFETIKSIEMKIQERFLVQTELGNLICSISHVFYTERKENIAEINAEHIKKGSLLLGRDGQLVRVKNIRKIKKGIVYSIKLTGPHNIYIANGLLHKAN